MRHNSRGRGQHPSLPPPPAPLPRVTENFIRLKPDTPQHCSILLRPLFFFLFFFVQLFSIYFYSTKTTGSRTKRKKNSNNNKNIDRIENIEEIGVHVWHWVELQARSVLADRESIDGGATPWSSEYIRRIV